MTDLLRRPHFSRCRRRNCLSSLIPLLSIESFPSSPSFVYDKLAGLVGEKLTENGRQSIRRAGRDVLAT